MSPSRRALLQASVAAALGASCSGASGGGGYAGPTFVPPPAELPELEAAMFELVNRDRAAAGLPPLAYDETLAGVARGHALDMRTNRFFAHDSPTTGSLDDRLGAADVPIANARENLAESYEVNAAQAGLMKSPGHHANLMATDVTHVGIGVVRGGAVDPNNMLFVQVFSRPVPREDGATARENVLATIGAARAQAGRPPLRLDARLEELAAELLPSVNDDVDESSVRDVSERLIEVLRSEGPVPPLTVIGRRVAASTLFVPERVLVEAPSLTLGLAAEVRRDDVGKRFLKLLLFARAE